MEVLGTTKPTANKAVTALVDAGVLVETSGRRRDRTFSYAAYLDRLRAGTEIESGKSALADAGAIGLRDPAASVASSFA